MNERPLPVGVHAWRPCDPSRKAAEDLGTTVTAARADPGPMTLAAVGDAAAWLRETVHRLGTAMSDTC